MQPKSIFNNPKTGFRTLIKYYTRVTRHKILGCLTKIEIKITKLIELHLTQFTKLIEINPSRNLSEINYILILC